MTLAHSSPGCARHLSEYSRSGSAGIPRSDVAEDLVNEGHLGHGSDAEQSVRSTGLVFQLGDVMARMQ
jgi:hypothetical protein